MGWGAYFQVSALGHQVQVRGREIGHPSSILDPVIYSIRVAGGSPRWQVAALPPCLIDSAICPLSSIQPSIQPSVIDSALCHLSSTQSSSTSGGRWQPQVVGGASSALCHRFSHPFRPYQGRLGQHAVLPLPQGRHSPDTRYSQGSALPNQLQHLLRQQCHAEARESDEGLGDRPGAQGLSDGEAEAFLDHPEAAVVEV
jgi:hypothetical protein